ARQLAGGLAVTVDLDPVDERVPVTLGPLEEPAPSGGEVVADLGTAHGEPIEVDHVEIALVAGCEHAPVVQADRTRRIAALALDQEREVEPAAVAITSPKREQRGGEAA